MLPSELKDVVTLGADDISSAVLYCLATPQHVQVHEMMIRPMGEMF